MLFSLIWSCLFVWRSFGLGFSLLIEWHIGPLHRAIHHFPNIFHFFVISYFSFSAYSSAWVPWSVNPYLFVWRRFAIGFFLLIELHIGPLHDRIYYFSNILHFFMNWHFSFYAWCALGGECLGRWMPWAVNAFGVTALGGDCVGGDCLVSWLTRVWLPWAVTA